MASMPLPAGSGDGGPGEHRSLIELTTDDPAWHNPPSPMMVSPSQTAPCGPGPGAAGAAGPPGLTAGAPGGNMPPPPAAGRGRPRARPRRAEAARGGGASPAPGALPAGRPVAPLVA